MWTHEARHTTTASPDAIWQRWIDVSSWPKQDSDMETARLDGPLATGTTIIMKPKGAKETSTVITVLDPKAYRFTNESKLPFGFLRFEHEIVGVQLGKTEFLHRVSMKGPLTPILRKVFADKMVAELPVLLATIARFAEATDARNKQ